MKIPRNVRKTIGPASIITSTGVRSDRTPPAGSTSPTLFGSQLVAYCRAGGRAEPVTEWEFHPDRRWRFDYAWPAHLIALEVEGLTHEGGRHQTIKGYSHDLEKYNAAGLTGWLVLRCTYKMLSDGTVYRLLDEAFRLRGCDRIAPHGRGDGS